MWDKVQATLVHNRIERIAGRRSTSPSLLTGLLFDQNGEWLTPTHAVKKGTRYRYNVSTALETGARKSNAGGWRMPAGNLETLVTGEVRRFLLDQGALLDALGNDVTQDVARLMDRTRQIAATLEAPRVTVKPTLMTLVACIALRSDRIDILMSPAGLVDCLPGDRPIRRGS